MKSFLYSMLSRKGGVSSKRVWGSIIMSILCFTYVFCVVTKAELPEATDLFIGFASLLLGLDTVVKPFSKTTSTDNEQE